MQSLVFICLDELQSITLKEYPAELSLTSLVCFMGMVEGGIVALVMERDMTAWAIAFDFRLLAAAYSVSCIHLHRFSNVNDYKMNNWNFLFREWFALESRIMCRVM